MKFDKEQLINKCPSLTERRTVYILVLVKAFFFKHSWATVKKNNAEKNQKIFGPTFGQNGQLFLSRCLASV